MSGVDSEVNEDDQNASYKKFESHEAMIFSVELSDGMFETVPELNKIQLIEILESLEELMSQLIVVRPNAAIGCYFHYCGKEGNDYGIYEFFPLSDINAKNMKKLSDLLEDLRLDRINLIDFFQYNNAKKTSMEKLFTFYLNQFSMEVAGQRKYTFQRIFLFTDNDSPIDKEDKEAKSILRKIVDDLDESHVNFVPFFIGRPDAPFNSALYSEILKLGARKDSSTEYDGPNTTPIQASYIKSKVLRKREIKRVAFRCPLILNEKKNFIVGLRGYIFVSHEKVATRYKLVYEYENLRQEAFSRRKFLSSETAEEIKGKELTKIFTLGDLDIEVDERRFFEVEKADDDVRSFLKVVGFRSIKSCVKYINNIDKVMFVVPDEMQYVNSIKILTSLFKTLRTKGKAAIIWGKLKANSNPSLFVLEPSGEKDPNEGFYLHRVPFLDEIRKLPTMITYECGENTSDYENLIKVTEYIMAYFNLKGGYNPMDLKNPCIQKYFKILHDYLLQIEDKTSDESSTERKQRLLREDDTLRKVSHIREKIISSSRSEDAGAQKLSKYIKVWNNFYAKIEKESVSLEPSKTKKRKPAPTLNL
ncbi:hypothetical protein KAFR_0L01950 [Kazachstania africana CBS 2517]|uniref:ATP-dependent DNA helicase II subunit 1 n=1 Tax=Kazachstania africana (strain ATCC 22294 / BCRC 22015 / CBS 2517 / CECT 1963 / NBRC 1671 / NRRL Y-8276) TaxID=1071382 RepID=H2B2F6_KAZAF|nr:hypothetical protein KAFR_0L01950 [Kazachstania africana CBS 2517]CCF60806.1 hypothetical protein KAFR_0L01950 [Kazachstania africana CBS 2517]